MKNILKHRILFPVLAVALLCAIVGGGIAIAAVLGDIGTRHGQINVQEPIVLLDDSPFAITLSPGVNAFVSIPLHNLASNPVSVGLEIFVAAGEDTELYVVYEGSPRLLVWSIQLGDYAVNPGDSTITVEFQLGTYYSAGTYDARIEVWRGSIVDVRYGTLTVDLADAEIVLVSDDFVLTGYAGDVVTEDFTVHNELGRDIPLVITAEFSVISGPGGAQPALTLLTTSAVVPPGVSTVPVGFLIAVNAYAGAEYGANVTLSRGDVT